MHDYLYLSLIALLNQSTGFQICILQVEFRSVVSTSKDLQFSVEVSESCTSLLINGFLLD